MATRVEVRRGSSGALHALEFPETATPHVWRMEPDGPALVMGSGQAPELFDRDRLAQLGVELAPRRSGGGAVWIDPATTVWVDVLAPRGSTLWSDDLTATFVLVGRVWQRAFAECGVYLDLARFAPRDPRARWVCWAGIGWGELFWPGHLPRAGAGAGPVGKVLGLSQRRTRWGARIQGLAVIGGSPDRAADWFSGSDAPDAGDLRARVGRIPALGAAGLDRDRVSDAVAERLAAALDR